MKSALVFLQRPRSSLQDCTIYFLYFGTFMLVCNIEIQPRMGLLKQGSRRSFFIAVNLFKQKGLSDDFLMAS